MSARKPGPSPDGGIINDRPTPQVRRLREVLAARNDALTKYSGFGHLLGLLAALLEAPVNRFGKPEFYGETARKARDEIRELACHYNVGPSDTILHQAAKVARAALAKVQP